MLGVKIFTAAIASVFFNWRDALRILLVPVAALMAVNLWAASFGWEPPFGVSLLAGLVDAVFVCVVAVSWHRLVLIGEVPGAVAPHMPMRTLWKYFLSWFAIGLIITFMLVALGTAAYYLFYLLATDAIWNLFFKAFNTLAPVAGPLLVSVVSPAFFAVWIFTYALFRLGLRLPARAVYERSIGLDVSRMLTKPIRGALLVASALASVGTVLLVYGPLFFWPIQVFADEQNPWSIVASNTGYALMVLFGAAILNEIFRLCVPTDELALEAKKAGAGEAV